MDNNAIIYLRVSTKAQGDSGLGLEAQLSAVENYTKANGMTIIHRYTEVESGKVAERIQLAKALAHCKRSKGCVLVIAKLDRLSRSVKFLSNLMDSGVPFVAVDQPRDITTANRRESLSQL